MRLYRGTNDRCALHAKVYRSIYEPPPDVYGRWFTSSQAIAEWYVRDAPHGVLVYVDVPTDIAHQSWLINQPREVQRFSRDLISEYFIPAEWAARTQPL